MAGYIETEIKIAIPDLSAFRRKIAELRGRAGKRRHEFNTLFDTADGRLRRGDELLRLRVYGGQVMVTFKGRSRTASRGRAERYKSRTETEFSVSNAAPVRAALRALGFRAGFRYEKYRSEVRLRQARGVHICLDETPIGAFVEIEGRPRAIDRAARLLGYGPGDYLTHSYLALYAEFCRSQGRKMGDFLFSRTKRSPKRSFALTKKPSHLNKA